jgi:hypothetical protein
MGFLDGMIASMGPGDKARTDAWIRENVIRPTIEELFMPHNLDRLAIAIASEVKRQSETA